MTQIAIDLLLDNPYRDRNAFPTREKTILGLMESISQTDFWDNLLSRFANNTTSTGVKLTCAEDLKAYMASPDFDPSKERFQLAYGHHRLDALKRMDFAEIDIPVKFINDETMLRIMSNENKSGWGSSLQAQLETVRQILTNLHSSIDGYGETEHNLYLEDGNTFFDYNSFTQAKQRGIGYRKVHEFLGKEWSLSDVRIPMAVMGAIEKGFFTHDQLSRVPSAGLLDIGAATITGLLEGANIQIEVDEVVDGVKKKVKKNQFFECPVWPKYYMDRAVESIIDMISVPEDRKDGQGKVKQTFVEAKATVARMKAIRKKMLIEKVFPGPKGSKTEFDVVKAIKRDFFGTLALDYETEEDRLKAVMSLRNVELPAFQQNSGFVGYHMMDAIVASVTKAIDLLEAGPVDDGADALRQDQLGDDAEYQGSDKYADDVDGSAVKGMFEDVKDQETGETTIAPTGKVIAGLMATLSGVNIGLDKLVENAQHVDMEKEGDFTMVLHEAVMKLTNAYGVLVGKEQLTAAVSDVMKSLG